MKISIIVVALIVIILILIALLITYLSGYWNKVALPAPDTEAMTDLYSVPSAWSSTYPKSNSTCQAYTFVSTNGEIPQPNINSLNNNNSNYTVFPINSGCTDSDQIFAQNSFHVCRYGEFPDIPITQFNGCPLVNGGFTKINGYYEEYYNTCGGTGQSTLTDGNSTRCLGSVGLITYNYTDSISSATCIVDPLYTIEGQTVLIPSDQPLRVANPTVNGSPPVITGGCSISATQNGFPSQLFRVIRYAWDNSLGELVQNNTGSFVQIIHRPTGKGIAPYTLGTDGKTPIVSAFNPNKEPILVETSSFGNLGAWWFISPKLQMPQNEIDQLPNPANALYSLPQLVWAPNPKFLGQIKDDTSLWEYLTNKNNNVFSLVPFRIDANIDPIFDRMTMQPYITYRAASPAELPNVLPPVNPASLYFPTLILANNIYAPNNKDNPASECFGYKPSIKGFTIQVGSQNVNVPLSQTHPCYVEFKTFLTESYNSAITAAKYRIIAENAAVNYIDLTLINIMLNSAQNFYNI